MKTRSLFWAWAAAIAWLPAAAQINSYEPVTASQAYRLAINSPGLVPSISQALKAQLPVIVFVPGILGSTLKWSNYTFGVDPVDGKRLVFKADSPPTTETLNSFRAAGLPKPFSKLDIYGVGLDALKEVNEGRAVEEFSYDWRADIDDSAKALQKWLLADRLKKRKVVFVAHSMGGLVLWRWFQLFAKHERAVDADQAIFVGSPLQGSCEAARMLIEGYSAPKGSGIVEEWATQTLFNEARGALFTFPSIFQLLPRYSRDKPCLSLKSAIAGLSPQNHHEQEFWIGRPARAGGMKGGDGAKLAELAASTGLAANAYEASVRKAIEAGARFRAQLAPEPPDGVQTIHLYSDRFAMASSFQIAHTRAGWYEVVSLPMQEVGDGRVLPASARNDGFGNKWMSMRVGVASPHGEMMKDPQLLKFIKDNVVAAVSAAKIEALAYFLNNGKEQNGLQRFSYVIDPGTAFVLRDEKLAEAQRVIALHNLGVVSPLGKTDAALTLKAFGRASLDLQQPEAERKRLAASLFESAFVIDPAGITPSDWRAFVGFRTESNESAKALATSYWLSTTNWQRGQKDPLWTTLANAGLVDYTGKFRFADADVGANTRSLAGPSNPKAVWEFAPKRKDWFTEARD